MTFTTMHKRAIAIKKPHDWIENYIGNQRNTKKNQQMRPRNDFAEKSHVIIGNWESIK